MEFTFINNKITFRNTYHTWIFHTKYHFSINICNCWIDCLICWLLHQMYIYTYVCLWIDEKNAFLKKKGCWSSYNFKLFIKEIMLKSLKIIYLKYDFLFQTWSNLKLNKLKYSTKDLHNNFLNIEKRPS